MGSGRAAWLVLTGEPLVAGDRGALAAQKQLLQLWEERPLSISIPASIERFVDAYARGWAQHRMKGNDRNESQGPK